MNLRNPHTDLFFSSAKLQIHMGKCKSKSHATTVKGNFVKTCGKPFKMMNTCLFSYKKKTLAKKVNRNIYTTY